jgi:hypothetical protein
MRASVVRLNPSASIALLIDVFMSLPMAIAELLSRESPAPFRMRKLISGGPYRRFPRYCGGLDTYAMFTAGGDLLLLIKLHLVSDL